MGKFIPVEPEKWAEMVKALALVKEMDKTINASQAECRRLKEKSECQAECLEAFDKENAGLKAEVERLTALVESNLNSSKVAMGKADEVLHERDSLRAEVERLRKAGDEMEKVIILAECIAGVEHTEKSALEWNAAKEGKQS